MNNVMTDNNTINAKLDLLLARVCQELCVKKFSRLHHSAS